MGNRSFGEEFQRPLWQSVGWRGPMTSRLRDG